MKIQLKQERFKNIESCFTDLKEKSSNTTSISTIEKELKDVFHKNIKVQIVNTKPSDTFFVMSIFPDQSTLAKVVECIVNQQPDEMVKKIWDSTENWTIEIDKRIITGNPISLTAEELTALVLHEIGHIVYSNALPHRITHVMKLEYARASTNVKALLNNKLFSKILALPIVNGCTYDNYKTKDNIKQELKADVFVTKMGYSDALESALTKFIGSRKDVVKDINKTPQNVYNDMKRVTLFSLDCVENFKLRKAKLVQKNLSKLLLNTPSKYITDVIHSIELGLTKTHTESVISDESRMIVVQESANEIVDEFIALEFFEIRGKKLKRINPIEIDYIDTEISNIRTNDDKMLLLSYTYSKINRVQYYLDILDNPKYSKKYRVPNTREELLLFKKRLDILKDKIINYKIPEIKYGIHIQYPAGYEG